MARSSQPTRKAGQRVQRLHSMVLAHWGGGGQDVHTEYPPTPPRGRPELSAWPYPCLSLHPSSHHTGLLIAPEATHRAFAPASSLGTQAPDPPWPLPGFGDIVFSVGPQTALPFLPGAIFPLLTPPTWYPLLLPCTVCLTLLEFKLPKARDLCLFGPGGVGQAPWVSRCSRTVRPMERTKEGGKLTLCAPCCTPPPKHSNL